MNFEVNGIAFSKDELSTITLKELRAGVISYSHLFYIPEKSKKAFMILRAGDYIDQEFLDKYIQKGLMILYALEVATSDEISKYKSLISSLKNAYDEKERQVVSQRIIQKFGKDFWRNSESSYLSFVLPCFESFYNLPMSVVEKYQNTSLTLYSRAMISASLSVVTCLVHRIVDPSFIKDLYNSVFVLDYGLLEDDKFTYSLVAACEAERNIPGSGIPKLQAMNRSMEEVNFFVQHPTQSAKYIETLKEKFTYPEVIDVVQYHHEKGDGTGFPAGVNYSGIGDFETFQMFCDYLVPFREHIYKKGDGAQVIKSEFLKIKSNENMSLLPIKKILSKWESCMEWTIQSQEILEEERVA